MRQALTPVLAVTIALFFNLMPSLAQPSASETPRLEIAVWYDGPSRDLAPLRDIAWLFQQHDQQVLIQIRQHPTLTAYEWLTRWTGTHLLTAPDLVVINSRWLPQFREHLVPLDALAQTPPAQKIIPSALRLFTVGGQLMAVPWCVGARALVVRSDLLAEKELDAPETWEQVAEVAAALHQPPEIYGVEIPAASQSGGATLLCELIWAEGDSLFDETGALNLTTEAKQRALARFCELADYAQPEVLSWPQTELETLFAQGRLGMLVADTWIARGWQGREDMPAYQVLPLPAQAQAVGHLMGDGLAILNSSERRDLAVEFVRLLLSRPAQEKLIDWGGLPVHQELLPGAGNDPLIAALLPTLPQAHILAGSQTPQVMPALEYAIYLAVTGRLSPALALQATQEAFNVETVPSHTGAPLGVQ